jgi:hypothetical protein
LRRTPISRRSKPSSPRSSAKIEQLEKAQTQTKKTVEETQATADKTADVVAQGRAALSFAGDLRYRNESFDVQYVDRNRQRDRIRARLNATYRVNDTINGVFGISTGSADPRSGNQTLTDQNARKDFDLDVAYVTWAPNAKWKVTAGKQRYPWQRTGSLFFDNDVNPEGMAVNFATGNFFAATFYDWLAERAHVLRQRDVGHQHRLDHVWRAGGYRFPLSDATRLTVAGNVLQLRWRAGLQPAVRWQLVRQHDHHQRRGVQPAPLAAGHCVPRVRLRHHRSLRGSHDVGSGGQTAAALRRLRAEQRSRSESGRG